MVVGFCFANVVSEFRSCAAELVVLLCLKDDSLIVALLEGGDDLDLMSTVTLKVHRCLLLF
jgi:hypothetical protein